jgi:class 3 adenylate cyclase
MDDRAPRTVPEDYDAYYLRIVQACLKYACPTAAALHLAFFGWDLLFVRSVHDAAKTLFLRLVATAWLLALWLLAPRIRSVRVLMFAISATYVFVLFVTIAVLTVIPDGLNFGVAGLLLCTMFACGMFCLRPLPAAICGLIGLGALIGVCFWARLSYSEIASNSIFFASGTIVSWGFLILLDRELRHRHALERALEKEKEQSELLLHEILPRYVIQRIREGAASIAESVSEVNIIFIDIVGFTTMSKRLAPIHLVEILGQMFRSFDDRCEQHGVTKIKTIGDAYMAATGASQPTSDTGVAAVEFCVDAIHSVAQIARRTGVPLQIRVGIATGAAISGVLSLKRPAYDLWGDTVNLAARMESSGEPGKIHIAETTYWRVKDRFECEPRGVVEVKGFGPIQTYMISAASEVFEHDRAATSQGVSGSAG